MNVTVEVGLLAIRQRLYLSAKIAAERQIPRRLVVSVIPVGDRVVEAERQSLFSAGVGQFFGHVPSERRVHDVVVGRLGVPHAKAIAVLGDIDQVLEPARLECGNPFGRVELLRVERLVEVVVFFTRHCPAGKTDLLTGQYGGAEADHGRIFERAKFGQRFGWRLPTLIADDRRGSREELNFVDARARDGLGHLEAEDLRGHRRKFDFVHHPDAFAADQLDPRSVGTPGLKHIAANPVDKALVNHRPANLLRSSQVELHPAGGLGFPRPPTGVVSTVEEQARRVTGQIIHEDRRSGGRCIGTQVARGYRPFHGCQRAGEKAAEHDRQ